MITYFSELCEKEVVNCNDGRKLGNVTDIEINTDERCVIAIIVSESCQIFKKSEEIKIPWDKIQKIGTDVIIVDYKSVFHSNCHGKCDKRKFSLK